MLPSLFKVGLKLTLPYLTSYTNSHQIASPFPLGDQYNLFQWQYIFLGASVRIGMRSGVLEGFLALC